MKIMRLKQQRDEIDREIQKELQVLADKVKEFLVKYYGLFANNVGWYMKKDELLFTPSLPGGHLSIQFADNVADLPIEEWDIFVGDIGFKNWGYYRIVKAPAPERALKSARHLAKPRSHGHSDTPKSFLLPKYDGRGHGAYTKRR